MTKQQLIDKILGSSTFEWRGYATKYGLHGIDSDETVDNIELHLLREPLEVISMMYEANCPNDAMNRYDELREYDDYESESFSHLEYK